MKVCWKFWNSYRMQREDQSGDQSRLAFRTKMGIYFKNVKGIIHEMIQQLSNVGVWSRICSSHGITRFIIVHTHAHDRSRLNFCCLCLSDVYFIISIFLLAMLTIAVMRRRTVFGKLNRQLIRSFYTYTQLRWVTCSVLPAFFFFILDHSHPCESCVFLSQICK